MRKPLLTFALVLVAATAARQSGAQLIDPFPPSSEECPGPDFFIPGNGYVPLGSIHDGLVVTIADVSRYSGIDNDQDWNFNLRPIDRATCPDGQKLFGRDCASERQKFIDIFWSAATMDWQFDSAYALAKFGERSTLTASERQFADKLAQGVATTDLGQSGPATALHIGKKMWAAVQLDPQKFASYTAMSSVEAEVGIDDLDPDDEGASMLHFEHLASLAGCPGDGGKLCSAPALVYGAAMADTKHEGGKPELHPLRALVTRESVTGSSASYKVRTFADYGKAGGAGGGSIGGHICENWVENKYRGGNYLSYVSIKPESFPLPGNTGPAQVNGTGAINEPVCRLTTLDVKSWNGSEGLHNFAVFENDWSKTMTDFDFSSCPTFIANPMYRGTDEQHRVWGGWGVAKVDTQMTFKGMAKHWITVGTPVSLGAKTTADTLGDRKAPYAAHWWKVPVKSHATLAGKDLTFQDLSWSIPAPMFAVRPNQFSWDADVYVGVGSSPHTKYDIDITAKLTMWTKEIVHSSVENVSVPHASVSAKGTHYGYEVVTAGGKKSLVYKPTLQAKNKQFATTPKYSWYRHSPPPATPTTGVSPMPGTLFGLKVGDGETVTLSIPESDKANFELRGQDAYEKASASLKLGIPRANVDAPASLQVKGGSSATGKLTKMTGGGSGSEVCLTTSTQPVTFFSDVKLVGKMFVPRNPYGVPLPTSTQYQWGKVEKRVPGSTEEWQVYANAAATSSAGTNQDTLTVKIGAVPTDDFMQLNEFRVTISATEDYGRAAKATVYFNNWESAGLLSKTTNCIDVKATTVSSIPPWQWGVLDPLRTVYDPARDAGVAMRNQNVLAHANLFMNLGPQKGAFLPSRSQVGLAGAPRIDMSKLVTRAPLQRAEHILGASVDPRTYGLTTARKLPGDYASHLLMQNIRAAAPLIGPAR